MVLTEMTRVPVSAAGSRDLSELVIHVFERWHEAGVAFLVLRNYEQLPQNTGNDIDVLVRPYQLEQAEEILISAAREAGYHFHNRAEFSPVSMSFYHPETLQQIQFDLFYNHQWRGFDLLDSNAVLDRRKPRGLFAVPDPVHEAVSDLLTRLIFHGYVKENYKSLIVSTARAYTTRMRATLAEIFGPTVAERLTSAILGERWEEVEACFKAMRRELIWRRLWKHPLRTLGSFARDYKRFLMRLIRPPGLTVVLIGPDGSGKSTVADRLAVQLSHTFRPDKSLRVHWKPVVFFGGRRAARPPTTQPHAQPPRNMFTAFALLFYHWIEYWLGWLTQFLRVTFRNGLVLIDRYAYDFIVDPRRYRMRDFNGVARGLFALLPRPDLVFYLSAPEAVLRARKAEVSPEETARQCEEYRRLVERLPNARTIRCDQPVELVTAEVTREILQFLEARQKKRS